MPEFQSIQHRCGETTACDLNLLCDSCSRFQKRYIFIIPLLALLGLSISWFFDLFSASWTYYFHFGSLFTVAYLFLGFTMKKRLRELALSSLILLPAQFMLMAAFPPASAPTLDPQLKPLFLIGGSGILFLVFVYVIFRGFRDAQIYHNLSKASFWLLFMLAFNLLLMLALMSLRLMLWWGIEEMQLVFDYMNWINYFRILLTLGVGLGIFIYASYIAFLKTAIPAYTGKLDIRKLTDIQDPFEQFRVAMQNNVDTIRYSLQKAQDRIRRRLHLLYLELARIFQESLKRAWLVFLRALRFSLISLFAGLLYLAVAQIAGATVRIWQNDHLLGIGVMPQFIVILMILLLIVSLTFFSLLVYKKWDEITESSIQRNVFYYTLVGTMEELSEATRSIVFSIVYLSFILLFGLVIIWTGINLLQIILEQTAMPRSIGLMYLGSLVLIILLIVLNRKKRFSLNFLNKKKWFGKATKASE